ncbi:unnamed protein product [Timema podura]|uniref:BTB domain-containing protein n=2 Tax=Timema TaxID=61471 RepID=A0ABN7PCD4_TIMPD|nr:unnamed protein product [Timema podura]
MITRCTSVIAMAEEQQFCLRWNNFHANITSQFEALRDEEDFVDVTLACDGQRLKAHKVVLSACSPYFKELFKSNPCKHPILFLRDVEFSHLQSLVEFMYAGEVNVAQAQLSSFLHTAESLQIRGLTEAPQRHKHLYRIRFAGEAPHCRVKLKNDCFCCSLGSPSLDVLAVESSLRVMFSALWGVLLWMSLLSSDVLCSLGSPSLDVLAVESS